jgi:hypothetical protein
MDAQTRFVERIRQLADRADRDRQAFEPPADPPDEQRAMDYLREGAGPAISLFVEARTGGHAVRFPPEDYHALEDAMNTWFDLYAACYGVDLGADFALREAAELLVDTHNVRDVAVVLTHVPSTGPATDDESGFESA